ncbi:phosphatase PAP2 family protein [Pseudomonas sp. Fl5BN2]|uniref:acid phosphatase n=1 Tax=unclassified Pseudomonas TaxID=196821 RepID=UPI001378AB2F|nr:MULTISPECIES: phosphatase PAP2 family protein [unclassified Pseudomonas]NBF02311.1 phosphatase PAP2 family protein [Pseudomonas sp. Fl5BN2]NBF12400.1 phosphatase PAP2 family protein [Pseudomonas sp. Fl4BN1]
MKRLLPKSLTSLLLLTLVDTSIAQQSAPQEIIPEASPGYLIGYLSHDELPNSLLLLPPPPAPDTPAFSLDLYQSEKNQALRGSKRWELAISDAELKFPAAAEAFACALDAPISEQQTPALYRVLRRSLTDAGLSTSSAKDQYNRTRPFVFHQQSSCTPDHEAALAKNGSYPSGHSSIGWAWALLLSELAPERGDALLARGRAYTESRMVCNVHWYSDIREGREIGAATVTRLHSNPTFQADFAAARQELAAVRAKGLTANRDCEAESQALAQTSGAD